MNIAIDIDDTLTESFDYFLPFVAEYFGADVNRSPRESALIYGEKSNILFLTAEIKGW